MPAQVEWIQAQEEMDKLEIIYQAYRGLMYHTANQILHHPQDAEDVVQEAFVSIAGHLSKIDHPVCSKTKAYVVAVARSKAIDCYRRKQRHPELTYQEEHVGVPPAYFRESSVAQCILQLPKRYRQALLLRYWYGYDRREIAELLHITEANATKLIQRAKKRLYALCREAGILCP